MDNIHVVKETILTFKKKPFALFLPQLGSNTLQTMLEIIKNLAKFQVALNTKTRLVFHFKGHIPKDLTSGVV